MAGAVCWLLLFFAAGSLVPVTSSLSCEEQLQAVAVDPDFCDRIRAAVKSVRRAVLDIDAKISDSTKETINEATEILASHTKLLKSQLPKYLPSSQRKKRNALEKEKRQDDLSDFHALAKSAASSAVAAVKDASKEIRDALFHALLALHSSQDQISEAAKHILGKVMSKRSVADEAVADAMLRVSVEMKASMTKAVLTALSGFKDMMNNMEVKIKSLLQGKVRIGFFDDSKAQIADLADKAAKDLVDYYDSLARKTVNDAILKVNELLIAVYVVEKSNQNPAALSTMKKLTETESEAIKAAIQSEVANPEESVALAMKNAADQLLLDYHDIARLVKNA